MRAAVECTRQETNSNGCSERKGCLLTAVFGWKADAQGAGHYRIGQVLDELARRGHQTSHDRLLPAVAREEADVIIGQRVCQTGPSELWQQMCREARAVMVFEIDDDLFHVDPGSIAAHRFFSIPEVRANLRANIAAAHVVTVSTETLAEVLRPLNPNVTVVPNFISAADLALPVPVEHPTLGPTVGWYGSESHAPDFTEAAPQIVRYLRRNPRVRYHQMGGTFGWERAIESDQFRVTGWIDGLAALMREIDFQVGLAPLLDNAFNRSKSDLKAKELAALGIPIVASAVGPYLETVQEGVTGLLVRREHEWNAHLHALLSDEERRVSMGKAAREWAASQTIEEHAGRWLDAWGVA